MCREPTFEARCNLNFTSYWHLRWNSLGDEDIWAALADTISGNETWIVGGDYNSSETFDRDYQLEHRIVGGIVSSGNREIRLTLFLASV